MSTTSTVATSVSIHAAPARDGDETVLPVLNGRGALVPFHSRTRGDHAHVTLIDTMAGPLGGDEITIDATVSAGARLRVDSAGCALALAGPNGGTATHDTRITVGDEAELCWSPEPVIAAAGSDLIMRNSVTLAPKARLLLRDVQVLGRAEESPGKLATCLTVARSGKPILDQELLFGAGNPTWSSPVVLADHRATGNLLYVSPELSEVMCAPFLLSNSPGSGHAMVTPLAESAVLVTAAAPDARRVNTLLEEGHQRIHETLDSGIMTGLTNM
ncbi:urease accessory protein [Actinopolyspora biskrensis]|uniref:Urease accessory protein UreD n=1 Tax=Actinopolyspora biskrensis TaxID=1470178 RepID=A0A852Z4Z7_9ACTN|nr:urease accessory protein UreD [Actinopolyspora biskrensis]NYH77323.1 urease accessory protein [Actinopolyspora biskrensis]